MPQRNNSNNNNNNNRDRNRNQNSNGNNNRRTETRTVGTAFYNSNDPSANTSTTRQVRVAAGTPAGQSTNRVEGKPADHWQNAQYGSSFGRSDIARLQGRGFSNNEIMKIAQMAYSNGDVKKVNKVNSTLYELSNSYLNRPSSSMTVKGQTIYGSPYNVNSYLAPNKVLGWSGFGNGMTINKKGGSGEYSQSGVWSLPTHLTAQGGFTGTKPVPTLTENPGGDSTSSGGNTETIVDKNPPPYTQVTDTATVDPIGMMSGGGAGINSAMGIRRKKSSWKSVGTSTKGSSALNRGLTINSFNV